MHLSICFLSIFPTLTLTKVTGNITISGLRVAGKIRVAQQETQIHSATIDSLKAVHDKQVFARVVPIAGFARLVESLHSSDGNLDYRVRGDVDRQDRPLLRVEVKGTVVLQCQRCLDGFDYKIHVDNAVRLVNADALGAEHDDNPDEPDCVAASAEFDLAALVEDEVLLALPAYPRHEAGLCSDKVLAAAEAKEKAAGAKIFPFSALRDLQAQKRK
jgi:uncharacterized protein